MSVRTILSIVLAPVQLLESTLIGRAISFVLLGVTVLCLHLSFSNSESAGQVRTLIPIVLLTVFTIVTVGYCALLAVGWRQVYKTGSSEEFVGERRLRQLAK